MISNYQYFILKLNNNMSLIKYCPNCQSELTDSIKLAQGVKECKICNTRFYIIITSTK